MWFYQNDFKKIKLLKTTKVLTGESQPLSNKTKLKILSIIVSKW